ncbi:MAG: chitin disaccharide deacetylase [Candidatus Eremiobacteraeota bacterium]|nr:chitin disaccharide deacetylase [Candidatus Eremiobacteraeota bacterium]
MKGLIVNADDYNFTPGVCRGIIRAFQDGIVRSTSIMINMTGIEKALELLKSAPGLAVGIHLNITRGKSISPPDIIPTLVNREGKFRPHHKTRIATVDTGELELELTAQIEKAINLGIEPSHLDSHHHIHSFPDYTDVYIRLAKKYGLPMRSTSRAMSEKIINAGVKTAQNFIGEFYDKGVTLENLLGLLSQIPEGETVELMCHPGEADNELREKSSYSEKREKELDILTTDGLEERLKEMGFQLITYRDL